MSSVRRSSSSLRRDAEELLERSPRVTDRGLLPDSQTELIHELQVHQVELQMQNDALREAQLELEGSRERYRTLFEHAPIAYLALDGDGYILDVNVAAAELFGRPKSHLAGRPLARFVDADHADRFAHHARDLAVSDAPCRVELTLKTSAGQVREVRLESVRTREPACAWRTAIVDLSEVNRAARQLNQAQKLEAIGTLTSGAAHDFNNMLMVILGGADLALKALEPAAPARGIVDQIKRVAQRGRSIVEELLTFAREEPGPPTRLVDVDLVLEEMQAPIRQLLGEKIAFELELRAARSRVRFDGGQLQRVLLNLAANSRHAMPDGGRFLIETSVHAAEELDAGVRSALRSQPCLRIRVGDTGSGMDAPTLRRAFDPFFTTKAGEGGTGLGLSMVYGAVTRAGGHVELSSEPQVGTELFLYLPLMEGAPIRSRAPSGPIAPSSPPLQALLVEDDRLVRGVVRQNLEEAGYAVFDAHNADEALELMDKQSIDLLVTDVVLPGMQGPQLAALAATRAPELRVLLISAHSAALLADRGFIGPGTRVLSKPFDAEELRAELDSLGVRATAAQP